jgi:hypothetical protein
MGGFPENDTAYLIAAFGDSLAVSSVSGERFGLVSVDLAEFSTLYAELRTVPFIGYRLDGSTVTNEFTTDGVIDGTGPLADFETICFDSRFADVVRVEVPTYRWALDNMVFAQIPEPATGVLVLFGGLLLWSLRLRKQNASPAGDPSPVPNGSAATEGTAGFADLTAPAARC